MKPGNLYPDKLSAGENNPVSQPLFLTEQLLKENRDQFLKLFRVCNATNSQEVSIISEGSFQLPKTVAFNGGPGTILCAYFVYSSLFS